MPRVLRTPAIRRGRRRNNVAEKAKTVVQAATGALETESQIAVEVGGDWHWKWQETARPPKATRTEHQAALERSRVITSQYAEQAVLFSVPRPSAGSKHRDGVPVPAGALVVLERPWLHLRRAMGED